MTESVASKSYGTVSADRRQEMTGLEFVQGLADGALPLNTIAHTLGYDVAEAVRGRVVVTAIPTAALLNPAGTVHGGFTATLLDSCMGLAVQSTLEKGVSQTTLEFKISLVRPITPETGLIKAEGMVLNRGRRIGTAEGRVTDDKAGCSLTARQHALSSRTKKRDLAKIATARRLKYAKGDPRNHSRRAVWACGGKERAGCYSSRQVRFLQSFPVAKRRLLLTNAGLLFAPAAHAGGAMHGSISPPGRSCECISQTNDV